MNKPRTILLQTQGTKYKCKLPLKKQIRTCKRKVIRVLFCFFTTYSPPIFFLNANIFQQRNGLQIKNKGVGLFLMNQDTNAWFYSEVPAGRLKLIITKNVDREINDALHGQKPLIHLTIIL